jgi:hypothetical protein
MEEPISIKRAAAFMLSNPALLALCGTAYGLLIAYSYNLGYWEGLDLYSSVFPIQFWTISDLVSVSIWAAAPAFVISVLMFYLALRASRRKVGGPAAIAGRPGVMFLVLLAVLVVGMTAGELIGHNRGWGWVAFTPAICVLIAWGLTWSLPAPWRLGVEAPNSEFWPGVVVFVAILAVTLAYGTGASRAARLRSGTIYVEVGPSEKILELAGIKTDSKEPLKLLGRTSTGCLVLAPDQKSVIFVAADVQKVLWFRQHDKLEVPER